MSLILHLSDLHLSPIDQRQMTGDYKAEGLIPSEERQNRIDILRTSLSALAENLSSSGRALDSIVISGDVSLTYDEEGFQTLPSILESLGELNLEPERVVVVPGNHDVRKGSAPSTEDRYRLFRKYVRDAGYVTPLLEGIDINHRGAAIGAHTPTLLSRDGTFVVIAMNSANYCVQTTALSDAYTKTLAELRAKNDGAVNAAIDELEKLRAVDVARVSPAQLTALASALQGLPPPSAGGPMRVLALHHQLLPVSASEEFKPFEQLSNLGQLRIFAIENEINLVVHGHKHRSATYVDQVERGVDLNPTTSGQFLVSSVSTLGRELRTGDEFARLIDVQASYPSARRFRILSVPASTVGGGHPVLAPVAEWMLRQKDAKPPLVIFGRTVDDVYEQLLVLSDDFADDESGPLICQIQEGSTALSIPRSLDPPGEVASRQEWMDEIVDWWQRPDLSGTGRQFNHGQRIRRLQGIDQIREVVDALFGRRDTTRAYVQLIDPSRDKISNLQQRIPSFAAVHFLLRAGQLDCIGYFRKQQLRAWWPVNACEIARLQREVIEGLRYKGIEALPGSILTVAGVAVGGTSKPRVVVPRVDRLAQDHPEKLWAIAYEMYFGDIEAASRQLFVLFEDWLPAGQVELDGTAVSLDGLDVLAAALDLFGDRTASDEGRRLANSLRDLSSINRAYADAEELVADSAQRRVSYESWTRDVLRKIEELNQTVSELTAHRAATARENAMPSG